MVMLDVSKSMQVRDMTQAGQSYSRLQTAKSLIETMVTQQTHNRYGLGIFAGEAMAISPLTTDHDVIINFLIGVDEKNLSQQGTDLRAAIDLGTERFQDPDRSKVLLLISDGGDELTSNQLQSHKELIKEQAITVIGIALGTSE